MLTCLVLSTQPDLAAKRADESLHLGGVVRQGLHHAPDRSRPGGITGAARDDVDVKLRHEIAECRDVELVALGDLLQRARDAGDLRHQLRLLHLVEVDDLDRIHAPRHQQQPWIMRVLDDQDLGQRQIADVDSVLFQAGVQRPGGFGHEGFRMARWDRAWRGGTPEYLLRPYDSDSDRGRMALRRGRIRDRRPGQAQRRSRTHYHRSGLAKIRGYRLRATNFSLG